MRCSAILQALLVQIYIRSHVAKREIADSQYFQLEVEADQKLLSIRKREVSPLPPLPPPPKDPLKSPPPPRQVVPLSSNAPDEGVEQSRTDTPEKKKETDDLEKKENDSDVDKKEKKEKRVLEYPNDPNIKFYMPTREQLLNKNFINRDGQVIPCNASHCFVDFRWKVLKESKGKVQLSDTGWNNEGMNDVGTGWEKFEPEATYSQWWDLLPDPEGFLKFAETEQYWMNSEGAEFKVVGDKICFRDSNGSDSKGGFFDFFQITSNRGRESTEETKKALTACKPLTIKDGVIRYKCEEGENCEEDLILVDYFGDTITDRDKVAEEKYKSQGFTISAGKTRHREMRIRGEGDPAVSKLVRQSTMGDMIATEVQEYHPTEKDIGRTMKDQSSGKVEMRYTKEGQQKQDKEGQLHKVAFGPVYWMDNLGQTFQCRWKRHKNTQKKGKKERGKCKLLASPDLNYFDHKWNLKHVMEFTQRKKRSSWIHSRMQKKSKGPTLGKAGIRLNLFDEMQKNLKKAITKEIRVQGKIPMQMKTYEKKKKDKDKKESKFEELVGKVVGSTNKKTRKVVGPPTRAKKTKKNLRKQLLVKESIDFDGSNMIRWREWDPASKTNNSESLFSIWYKLPLDAISVRLNLLQNSWFTSDGQYMYPSGDSLLCRNGDIFKVALTGPNNQQPIVKVGKFVVVSFKERTKGKLSKQNKQLKYYEVILRRPQVAPDFNKLIKDREDNAREYFSETWQLFQAARWVDDELLTEAEKQNFHLLHKKLSDPEWKEKEQKARAKKVKLLKQLPPAGDPYVSDDDEEEEEKGDFKAFNWETVWIMLAAIFFALVFAACTTMVMGSKFRSRKKKKKSVSKPAPSGFLFQGTPLEDSERFDEPPNYEPQPQPQT